MTRRHITAYTLVDITDTGVMSTRHSNKKEYHQAQNMNVLVQIIGLRTQPFDITVTKLPRTKLSKFKFKTAATRSPVWKMKFYVEHGLVWGNARNPLSGLLLDAHNVAITSDLDNTVEFKINVFDTLHDVNLYFEDSGNMAS
jgi:hypothetical protein